MESPPRIHQSQSVAGNQPEYPARFAFIAPDCLTDLGHQEIDHDNPSGPENMDVSGRMIVRVSHDP